jgi:hypothetical protein
LGFGFYATVTLHCSSKIGLVRHGCCACSRRCVTIICFRLMFKGRGRLEFIRLPLQRPLGCDLDAIGEELDPPVACNVHVPELGTGPVQASEREGLSRDRDAYCARRRNEGVNTENHTMLKQPYNAPTRDVPMLTPSMLARKRLVNHSALAPFVVYTDAALPKSLAFSIWIASSHDAHS